MKTTDKDYLNRLTDQYDFLISDLQQYETGKHNFAYKIAATLRTIFYNTNKSTSILPALAERNGFTIVFKTQNTCDKYTTMHGGFVTLPEPIIKEKCQVGRNISFNDYWTETVFKVGNLNYTRRAIVKFAANKLGGAHVEPDDFSKSEEAIINGSIKIVYQDLTEEPIIFRIVYEMACQTVTVLNDLIPKLKELYK